MAEHAHPPEAEERQKLNNKLEPAGEIGEQLKNQRKARGISLVEVAEHTKIGKRYLEALEEGRYELLPCEAYIRGFLRAYAKYLELDEEMLLRQYKSLKAEKQSPEGEEEEREEEDRKNNQSIWVPLLSMLILAGAGAGLFLLWPSAEEEGVTNQEVIVSEAVGSGYEEERPVRVAGPNEPMILKIRGKEKTWITVMTDGRQEPDITLNPGEERTWNAQERFVLWTGNAGGIEVYFNGEAQPPLGKAGEVRKEIVFERPGPLREPLPE
ncbi:helix-turn-helix domain-containing protein [candidate division FCPU426 bacterium]|nr:helix-turn-helix domain-containing protein [candidate division FCPU426 bacterium]